MSSNQQEIQRLRLYIARLEKPFHGFNAHKVSDGLRLAILNGYRGRVADLIAKGDSP